MAAKVGEWTVPLWMKLCVHTRVYSYTPSLRVSAELSLDTGTLQYKQVCHHVLVFQELPFQG